MKLITLTGIICTLIILSGCYIVYCEPNYIRHADSCCLDENDNQICDGDEVEPEIDEPELEPEIIEPGPIDVEPEEMPEEKLITFECPDGTLVIDTADCPHKDPDSFKIELSPIKSSIKQVDQALFKLTVYNFQEKTDTFVVKSVDTDWVLSIRPLANPVSLFVAPGSRNQVSLILQPPKGIKAGDYSVTLQVTAQASKESDTIQADIKVT